MVTALDQRERMSGATLPFWQAGLIAAVSAAAGNAIVYAIGRALETIPHSVTVAMGSGDEPITLTPVISSSILAALVGTMIYAVLRRFFTLPKRLFTIIGVILVLVSLAIPFSIPDVPAKMALTLCLMHLVAAIAILESITRLVRS